MPDENTATTPSMPTVDPAVVSAEVPASEPARTSAPTASDKAKVNSEPVSSVIVEPGMPDEAVTENVSTETSIRAEVASKIAGSKNVLIALSSDPSVDEMAAAIGLSLFLDRLGKRATAIYSGATPNALEFLKPEETFETSADTLQDFVIALNKDKADHLRYKLDGDYVKIYITPYKARIAEEDLDFSYGDYNVDLVLALDVANGIDLDSALREHGRIMHDAVIINITTGNPGKFGEIEWSNKHASSVSEMIADLLYGTSSKDKIGRGEATAFLTGIVAATNRFSNAGTTSETMQIASKLMNSGANQQLVSKNITPDVENEMFSLSANKINEDADDAGEIDEGGIKEGADPTNLDISHGEDAAEDDLATEPAETVAETKDDTSATDSVEQITETPESVDEKDNGLLDDLKAAEASLAQTGAEAVPEVKDETVKIDSENNTSNMDEVKPENTVVEDDTPVDGATTGPTEETMNAPVGEKVLQPSGDFGSSETSFENENKYGKMLEDALESVNGAEAAPEASNASSVPMGNPAVAAAPVVPSNPEINGVPEMNYMPMPGEEILPPPPAPPVGAEGAMPAVGATPIQPVAPAMPVTEPTPEPLGQQPAMQDQVYGPAAVDPGAFKIPGM